MADTMAELSHRTSLRRGRVRARAKRATRSRTGRRCSLRPGERASPTSAWRSCCRPARAAADQVVELHRARVGAARRAAAATSCSVLAREPPPRLLPQIRALFEELQRARSRTSRTCRSFRRLPLDEAQRNATGRGARRSRFEAQSAPQVEVDPALIGGAVVPSATRSSTARSRAPRPAATAHDRLNARSCRASGTQRNDYPGSELMATQSFRDQRAHQEPDPESRAPTAGAQPGTVVSVTDGICRIHGLADVMQGEMLEFPGNTFGLALNLERDSVGAVVLGEYEHITEGDTVKTHRPHSRSAGRPELLGRVVDALGQPIDGKGPINAEEPTHREGRAGRDRAQVGVAAGADRTQGDRRDGADRPRPARADHRRPPDRQDRGRVDTIINQKGKASLLRLRRDRPEGLDRSRTWCASSKNTARWSYTIVVAASALRFGGDAVHRAVLRLHDGRILPRPRRRTR